MSQLLEDPSIWNDNERSQKLGKERRELEALVKNLVDIYQGLSDASELFEMAREENDDATLFSIEADSLGLAQQVEALEFRRMFSNPMDPNNCFMDFQSGSG